MREYSARLGRFFSADPLIVYGQMYVSFSAYLYAANNPVALIDWMGLAADPPKKPGKKDGEVKNTRDKETGEKKLWIWWDSEGKWERNLDDGVPIKPKKGWFSRLASRVWRDIKEVGHSFVHGYGTVLPQEYAKNRDRADLILGWAPYVGDAIDYRDFVEAIESGSNYDIAISGAGLMIPFVPGKVLKKGLDEGAEVVEEALEEADELIWKVGSYAELTKIARGSGLDAHHVGQKSKMKELSKKEGSEFDYDPKTAPSILVPKAGHTQRTLDGVSPVSTTGTFKNARALLARDIMELRRVYGNRIPVTALQKLVEMNKAMYPKGFEKIK